MKYIVIAFYVLLTAVCIFLIHSLFHYNYKYKTISKGGGIVIVYSDLPFDKGDKITYSKFEAGGGRYSANSQDTVIVVKQIK